MHPVVAVDGEDNGGDGEDEEPHEYRDRRHDLVHRLTLQHCLGGGVTELEHERRHEEDAGAVEAGTRPTALDHLRHAELGSLHCVECDEEGTEGVADEDGEDRPRQGRARGLWAAASEEQPDGREVGGEPDGELVTRLAVPLGFRDVVDRQLLDPRCLCLSSGSHQSPSLFVFAAASREGAAGDLLPRAPTARRVSTPRLHRGS